MEIKKICTSCLLVLGFFIGLIFVLNLYSAGVITAFVATVGVIVLIIYLFVILVIIAISAIKK